MLSVCVNQLLRIAQVPDLAGVVLTAADQHCAIGGNVD